MKLSQLAAKPQLLKVELNDDEIINQYGESLEFYVWDRQDMDTFVRLATLDYSNFAELTKIMRDLVLNEEGNPVIVDGYVLPTNVLLKAINKVVEELGKSVAPTGTSQTEPSK